MSVVLTKQHWIPEDIVGNGPRSGVADHFHVLCTGWSIGFLAIGYWLRMSDSESQIQVGGLVQFCAASLATLPVIGRLIAGLWENSAEAFADQLVVLAVLGAVATGEYSTAVLVPFIMDLGHFIEQRCIRGTQSAIDGLQRLNRREATVIDETGEHLVATKDLHTGQVLLVRPGEILAADGVVSVGYGAIDESTITGESLPRDVETGDTVHAGTIAIDGVLRVTVTGTGEQTSLGQIHQMLGQAVQSKTPVTRMLDRYAELYLPFVMLIAVLVLLTTRDLQRVIAVFIVSCPCALVIAGPATMIGALASACRQGILIKNAKFLEILASADTVVFDKTGTLTEGLHEVIRVVPESGIEKQQLLVAAFVCASASHHPVSRAIVTFCRSLSIHASDGPCPRIQEVSGRGIEAAIDQRVYRLGRVTWLSDCGIETPTCTAHCGPMVGVSVDDRFLGLILFQDRTREETPHVIHELRSLGVNRIVMLTGDRSEVANVLGSHLALDHVFAEALPQHKLDVVRKEVSEGRTVIVVGDGINDALALSAGSVGIALGARGADVAIQNADIALMTNDLGRIVNAIRLSRRSRQIIQQNVLLAVGSAAVMLALGSLGMITALAGAVLHNIGTVLVLINSARVLRAQS